MSKSLKRVERDAERLGLCIDVLKMEVSTKTAAEAATAIGAEVDQIVKSIIFRGGGSGRALLFLTAGGNQVDIEKAAQLAQEPLERADAAFIRAETGFAIGGVSPIGHLTPPRAFLDAHLMNFDLIWAAAGTPHHVFPISPADLERITGAQPADFTS